MTTLSDIISTYEERFDEKFCYNKGHYLDGLLRSDLTDNELKSFLRQFAADLIREAFEAVKVEKMKDQWSDADVCREDGFNQALSLVEARQREFINEQTQ